MYKEKYLANLLWLMLNIFSAASIEHRAQCPEMCTCEPTRSRGSKTVNDGFKLKCGGSDQPDISLEALKLNTVPDIVQLELSASGITHLEKSFLNLYNLQVLDLKGNQIDKIDTDSFKHLGNLTKLDLSNNKISDIQREIFEPLEKLENLKLSNNLLNHIYEGTFDPLVSIKQL